MRAALSAGLLLVAAIQTRGMGLLSIPCLDSAVLAATPSLGWQGKSDGTNPRRRYGKYPRVCEDLGEITGCAIRRERL